MRFKSLFKAIRHLENFYCTSWIHSANCAMKSYLSVCVRYMPILCWWTCVIPGRLSRCDLIWDIMYCSLAQYWTVSLSCCLKATVCREAVYLSCVCLSCTVWSDAEGRRGAWSTSSSTSWQRPKGWPLLWPSARWIVCAEEVEGGESGMKTCLSVFS